MGVIYVAGVIAVLVFSYFIFGAKGFVGFLLLLLLYIFLNFGAAVFNGDFSSWGIKLPFLTDENKTKVDDLNREIASLETNAAIEEYDCRIRYMSGVAECIQTVNARYIPQIDRLKNELKEIESKKNKYVQYFGSIVPYLLFLFIIALVAIGILNRYF